MALSQSEHLHTADLGMPHFKHQTTDVKKNIREKYMLTMLVVCKQHQVNKRKMVMSGTTTSACNSVPMRKRLSQHYDNLSIKSRLQTR